MADASARTMAAMPTPPSIEQFRYAGLDIDESGTLRMRYALDDQWSFEERVDVDVPNGWSDAATEAARLVYLLSGVSYYKAAAPDVIDLGDTPIRDGEIAFLENFYEAGLGEFAYRNGLDPVRPKFVGGTTAGPAPEAPAVDPNAALIPFGGGLDSIVSVEKVRGNRPASRLFVVSRHGDRFDAIERAAAVTGLEVVRADRTIDATILRSRELGFLNGHVPVTGILSSIAVLTAVLQGSAEVVMSNEWSSSVGNVEVDGRTVNHQYSKSWGFEQGFRGVLDGAIVGGPNYFSYLRSRTELWVAAQFVELQQFHDVFHSCNRAFHIDTSIRQDRWCGRCDKCCFIDLVLAPFMDEASLSRIFDGAEPLADESLLDTFRTLLGFGDDLKPFECVGDVNECRSAATLAQQRPDRRDNAVLRKLVEEAGTMGSDANLPHMLSHVGPTNAPTDLLD